MGLLELLPAWRLGSRRECSVAVEWIMPVSGPPGILAWDHLCRVRGYLGPRGGHVHSIREEFAGIFKLQNFPHEVLRELM